MFSNNALSNANYSSAQSVVDLKLSSVMCVPLIVRTELLGVIYLGNDSITGLFLFGKPAVNVSSEFA